MQEFSKGLKDMKIFLSQHEEHDLLRRFDLNGDGKVSMEEFYNTLAASIWTNSLQRILNSCL